MVSLLHKYISQRSQLSTRLLPFDNFLISQTVNRIEHQNPSDPAFPIQSSKPQIMALTSSSYTFTSLSAQFPGSKTKAPTRVHFRPCRISAACASTAERVRPHVSSLYEVLGIQTTATCHEVKTAYRRLARVLHPDVSGQDQDFIKVHEAYATLSDPDKRADYDRNLLFCRQRSVGSSYVMSASAFSGFRPRSWETDQCW